jgi:hypothetical protein
MINYQDYTDKIIECFKDKSDILGTDLKKFLGLENSGNAWGSLLSVLMAKKIIVKIEDKFEKVNSKPIYYYKLSPMFNNNFNEPTKNYIIYDQNGNIHDYTNDLLLEKDLVNLIKKNPLLELSVYKKIKTIKAEVKIITENLAE